MKYLTFLGLFLLLQNVSFCQDRNSVWCFGDSAGIDFSNLQSPVPVYSSIDCRGSAVSISDSSGNLLFYASTFYDSLYQLGYNRLTVIYNRNHQVMEGGDSIIGEGWYQELVIVPFPDSTGYYYLFSVGEVGYTPDGLYYSVIDLNQNGGLGKVIIKNVQLSNLSAFDGVIAVKHGNGRDWWLIFKTSGQRNPPNNDFYVYLVTPYGIGLPVIQSIGYVITTGGGCISFNRTGDKILMTDWRNLIQTFHFDRCTGYLTNPVIIEPENNFQYYEHARSCFSPSGNLIYVLHIPQTMMDSAHYLFQYDLLAPNVLASKDTIYETDFPNLMGGIQLAPDNKIYVSTWFNCGGFCFPYPDSVRNLYNENLGVINSPDSLGANCNFQPYSFYLGGKRTYIGLPNNPNYEMIALTGSACDSLPLTSYLLHSKGEGVSIFPNPCYNKTILAFSTGNKSEKVTLLLYDTLGKLLLQRHTTAELQELNVNGLARGTYFLRVLMNGRSSERRLVKL